MKLNTRYQSLDTLAATHSSLAAKIRRMFSTLPKMVVEEADHISCDSNKNSDEVLDTKWRLSGTGHHRPSGGWWGSHFDVPGFKISNGETSWYQPGIIAHGERTDGHPDPIIGLVVQLRDFEQNQLLLACNEPFKIHHNSLRPSLQTSYSKLVAVQNGETWRDPSLAKFLEMVDLEGLEWIQSDSANDGNRMGGGDVLYASVTIFRDELEEYQQLLGGEIFSMEEMLVIYNRLRWAFNPSLLAIFAVD